MRSDVMKRFLLLVLMLSPFMLSALPQADYEKDFATSKGKKLDIDLKTGGEISITGWARDVVSVKGFREGRDRNEAVLEMEETSSGVSIASHYAGSRRNRNGGIRLEISVPRSYNVHLETMGGDVSIAHVEGRMTGKTMGGALMLSGLKGNLDLLTMGGAVTLKNSDVDGNVKTMGGAVLIEDVTGDIKPSSMGGNVTQKNVKGRSGEVTGREVNISTMGGDINVDDAPLGAALSTMGGTIHVRSAARFVKAKTMGGKVLLDAVDGWMEATTMGGDVEATMTGNPSEGKRSVALTSMAGDITLSVPAGLSMDIDIELAYTEGHEGEYAIKSDFPIHQEVSPEWERDNGSPRKIMHGSGTVAGGSNRVMIKTVNGNVTIKRM
jgi:DUF4097 and DUF4098 domain-containing protein YvlB